jgi:hypothetical protein
MTADEVRAAVIATARSLKSQLKYSNAWVGATVAQLKARGAGDCSDFTQACFGAHGYTLSGMSYEQAKNGVEVASWRGSRGGANAAFIAIQPKLKPGDLVCMAIDSSRPGVISHVEIWIGDGLSIGHGGPGYGPTEHAITDWNLLQSATYWTARRIITDDIPEEEEMNDNQAYMLEQLFADRKAQAESRWAINQIRGTDIPRINGVLAAQGEAIKQLSGGTIDMDAITAAAEKGAKEGAAAITAADVAAQLEVKAK